MDCTVPEREAPRVRIESDDGPQRTLVLEGRLDAATTGSLWRRALGLAAEARGGELRVDASGLTRCDGAGACLLLELRQRQRSSGGSFSIRGLAEETAQLVELIAPSEGAPAGAARVPRSPLVGIGRSTLELLSGLRALVIFIGQLTLALAHAVRHPRSVRFRDACQIAERAGVAAVPIIATVGFLLGLILSFQSAIPMQRFGAQIYVADLLGISLVRELGPLMAAILLTARSGSAFAAEIGTMRVNEEIDALTTMGVDPVRLLVVPRVVAAIVVLPVLILLMDLAGLAGGAVVFSYLDFPLATYANRLRDAVDVGDLLGGLFKGMTYGIVVAAVGCLRGMQTGSGASAVGRSTTSAVVSGIVLIAIASAVFSVIFYVLEL